MKIQINKKALNDKFFNQIAKVNNQCILTVNSCYISTLTNTTDGSIVLYSKLATEKPTGLKEEETIQLDIPDVRRLSRIFDCITADDIELDIESNYIGYSNDSMSFKYHLLQPGMIQKSVASVDKISKLTFDSSFKITQSRLSEILKASCFITEACKPRVYFYTKDSKVYGEVTDRTMQNVDSATMCIADSFTGSEIKTILPVDIEVFRMLSGLKYDELAIKVDTKLKILILEINESKLLIKYIAAALVK